MDLLLLHTLLVRWFACQGQSANRRCYRIILDPCSHQQAQSRLSLPVSRKQLLMDKWLVGNGVEPRKQRRRTGAGGESDLEQVKQLAVSAAQLAMATAATVRVYDAALLRTWMLPATSTYAVNGMQAGKEYHSAVKAAGRSHGMGSPHLHIWASIIMTAKSDSGLQDPDKEMVTSHANSVTNPKDLETHVLVCNMRPAYNKEWIKVQFKVSPEVENLAKIIEAAFLKVGGEQKHGVAPKGPRERKLAELLEGIGARMPQASTEG